VAPLAGDGIVTGMGTVNLLLKHWDDPGGYEKAVIHEFGWMEEERRILEKLLEGNAPDRHDALVLKGNSRRMGVRIGLKDAASLLKKLQ
jgi:hypothetical protein